MKEERVRRELEELELNRKIISIDLINKYDELHYKSYRVVSAKKISDIAREYLDSFLEYERVIQIVYALQCGITTTLMNEILVNEESKVKFLRILATVFTLYLGDACLLFLNDLAKGGLNNISRKVSLKKIDRDRKKQNKIADRIERLSLLKKEIQSLKEITENSTICDYEEVEKEIEITKNELSKRGKN